MKFLDEEVWRPVFMGLVALMILALAAYLAMRG